MTDHIEEECGCLRYLRAFLHWKCLKVFTPTNLTRTYKNKFHFSFKMIFEYVIWTGYRKGSQNTRIYEDKMRWMLASSSTCSDAPNRKTVKKCKESYVQKNDKSDAASHLLLLISKTPSCAIPSAVAVQYDSWFTPFTTQWRWRGWRDWRKDMKGSVIKHTISAQSIH